MADFDPDAYLSGGGTAVAAPPEFDPDAYLKTAAVTSEKPDPSKFGEIKATPSIVDSLAKGDIPGAASAAKEDVMRYFTRVPNTDETAALKTIAENTLPAYHPEITEADRNATTPAGVLQRWSKEGVGTLSDIVHGLVNPENMALMVATGGIGSGAALRPVAAPTLSRIISGIFAEQMGEGAIKSEIKAASLPPRSVEREQAHFETAGNAALALAAGVGAAHPTGLRDIMDRIYPTEPKPAPAAEAVPAEPARPATEPAAAPVAQEPTVAEPAAPIAAEEVPSVPNRVVTLHNGDSFTIEPGKSITGRDVFFIRDSTNVNLRQVNTLDDAMSSVRTSARARRTGIATEESVESNPPSVPSSPLADTEGGLPTKTVPELKSTEEAVAHGESGKADVPALEAKREELLNQAETVTGDQKVELITQAQLYREAAETAESGVPAAQVESVKSVAADKGQAGLIQGLANQAREMFGPGAAFEGEFSSLAKERAREYSAIGASHLLEGKTDKASWTAAMQEEYGVRNAVPAELNKIWRDSHEFVSEFNESQIGKPLRPKTQIEESTGLRPTSQINQTVSSLRDTMSKMLTRAEGLSEYLSGQEKGSAIGSSAARKEVTAQVRVADKWLEADRGTIRDNLLDFAQNLPLNERAKFLPAITSALRRPPIFSRDPAVMYRRAEDVLNRMTEKVYDVRKGEVSSTIETLLAKTEQSKTITVEEKQAIRQRGVTFNALKDKMSLEMLERMRDRMEEIRQTGKELFVLDQVMQQERVQATLREIQDQGVRKIDSPEAAPLALGETQTTWQRRMSQIRQAPTLLKHFNLSLTPIDWLMQTFDKTPQGALYRTMKVPVDVQYGEWLDASTAYKSRLSEIAQKRNLNAGNFDRIYAHAELRQEGGLENLQARYSDKEIQSVKTLTRPELEYLREADKINNELFPALQEVLSKDFNQEVEKVSGYFPRERDWDYYNTLSIEEGRFARSMNRKNTEKGFTIERTGAITKNISNAHQVMMNHIDDVLYHIKLGPEIRRVADVVRSKDFASNVGTWGQTVFSDWVDVLARNGGIANGRRIRSLDTLRKNVGVAQLAFRLTTTALQPVSLIQGMSVVSPKNLALALDGVMSKTRRDFMLNNFPEIRARVGDDPAYSDYGGASLRDRIARGGFKAISLLDRFAALAVGEAAYRDSLASRGIPFDVTVPDPIGIQDAQLAVRKTQSSAYPKDVPLAISRGNFSGNASVDKAIFQFQNFLINKWALLKNGALQMGIEEKSPKAGARIMTFIILGTIAEQLARDGIARAIQATVGTSNAQDKTHAKEADKNYALQISEKAAMDMITSMPVVSNISGMARYEGSGIPVVDTLGDVISGITKLVEGKKAETKIVGGIRSIQAAGALAGVPTGQAGDIAVQVTRSASKSSKYRY